MPSSHAWKAESAGAQRAPVPNQWNTKSESLTNSDGIEPLRFALELRYKFTRFERLPSSAGTGLLRPFWNKLPCQVSRS